MATFTVQRYKGSLPRTEAISGVTWQRYTVLKNGVECKRIPHVWASDKKEAFEYLKGLVAGGYTR